MMKARFKSLALAGTLAMALGAALCGAAEARGGGGGGGGGDGSAGFIAPNPVTHVDSGHPGRGRSSAGQPAATTQGCVTYVHPYWGEICERGRR
ncbi:hypothetical protein [Phreatobacter sp. AB_2022a]|uniref:hypothetical protein n=1 Tax=Phreatobacter sp. AB_2022a TaxID=3003134 RepID=UPI002286FBF9|nr:hypothetical protein [Phreatobacter sp. AB_2022a]MCZ0738794.1 hypothetical protein [Phreatobacter sp. AB_2022a]